MTDRTIVVYYIYTLLIFSVACYFIYFQHASAWIFAIVVILHVTPKVKKSKKKEVEE